MKMKKRSASIGIFAIILTLFLAIPVQAKTTDIAKIMNKKVTVAAKALGFKRDYRKDKKSFVGIGPGVYRDSTLMTFAAKGKYSSKRSYIDAESYYRKKGGKWNAYIRDKRLSIYGVKIGMSVSKAEKKFFKNNWKKIWKGMYLKKNGQLIKLNSRNGKITSMEYRWQMESEY